MEKLNLPNFNLKIRETPEKKLLVFDKFRKKYVKYTEEERVRQLFLNFLTEYKSYPESLIAVEKGLVVNKMPKRFDAVIHNKKGEAVMLIEFKSPEVKLEQKVFEQAANYNLILRVNYLVISNGLQHFCCRMDYNERTFNFLDKIPDFEELS